jgi:hypothetical protein
MKASDRFFVEGVICSVRDRDLRVANLSVGGFFVATDHPPPLAEILDVDLTLGERAPFRFTGKVSWVNNVAEPKSDELPNGFGIKILKIAFPDKLAIVDHLKRIVHHEDGARGSQAR